MKRVGARLRLRAPSCALLALLALSKPALAGAPLSVALELSPCEAGDAAALRRIVEAELGIPVTLRPLPLDHAELKIEPEVAIVSVSCSGSFVELQVLDPVTGKTLTRHLEIPGELASARARVLGLSIAELVAASWIELTANRSSPARVVGATASSDTRGAALSAAKRGLATGGRGYEVESFALAQRLPREHFTSFGVGVGFGWLARDWLDLAADARGEAGTRAVSLGRINALLGSLALCPRGRLPLGHLALEAGLGARFGLAHLSGVASSDLDPAPTQQSHTLPWAGPLLELGLSARPLRPLLLSALLEAGFVSYQAEARVAGKGEFAIAGPWLSLAIGFGFSGVD